MCFAILKVSYRNASPALIEVENEADLEGKLEEVKGRPEVVSIKRFHFHRVYNLVPVWQESEA